MESPRRSRTEVIPVVVLVWTGREAQALRLARRMSVREFAEHLGVSDRAVSQWEAGACQVRPRPANQAALDTSLRLAESGARSRFQYLRVAGEPT